MVGGALVVVVAGVGVVLIERQRVRDEPGSAVVYVAADTGDVSVAVAASGALEPAATRGLGFAVDGTVASVAVRAGSKVAKGAVLATVDKAEAAEAVADAETTLAEAEDALDAAEAQAELAAAEQEAAALRATEAEAAASEVAASEAADSEAADSEATAKAGAAEVRVRASARVESEGEQAGEEGQAEAEAAPGGGQGDGSGSGDAIYSAQVKVNQAENALVEAKVALAGVTIKAPLAGTVLSVAGTVGSQVSAGATFVTVADTAGMRVAADFPEADAGALRTGLTGTVTLADRVGEEFGVKVVQVDPVGTAEGALVTYGVVMVFDETPENLLVGQSVAVEIETGAVGGAVRVPSTAVRGGTVLTEQGARTVEVGLRGDRYTEIKSGLVSGDLVARSW